MFNKRGAVSIFQISILVVSIFAFCFFLNGGFVRAEIPLPPGVNGVEGATAGSGFYKWVGGEGWVSKTSGDWFYNYDTGWWTDSITGAIGETPPLITAGEVAVTGTSSLTTPATGTKTAAALGKVGITNQAVVGIAHAVVWGVIIYGAVNMIGSLFGLDPGIVNAAATAAGIGTLTGVGAYNLFAATTTTTTTAGVTTTTYGALGSFLSPGFATGIGLAVAAIVFVFSYKDIEIEVVEFECQSWDSTTGGNYCEECNDGILPCSEYQCRSLGQACQIVNPNTDEAKCVWVSQNDVNPPIMESWDGALLPDYSYRPDRAISPPDRGVIIWNNKDSQGCVDAYTPLTFGINLDEPAKCKLDYLRKNSFEEMDFFFGGSSLLRYNHTQTMSLPGPNSEENLTLQNDGNFEFYARCQDANGNSNVANFVFKFCVNPGPDTTAPLIVSTNLLDGYPIAFGQTELDLELYVNEPSECRWSHLDQSYDNMENDFSCSTRAYEMNAQMLYTCSGTLDGLRDNFENKFYFRCKDQPTKAQEERNTNAESYEYTVIGTRPLVIDEVGPDEETIKDSTDAVQVTLNAETSAGYDDGNALCYYSETGEDEDYILFYETNSYEHSQDLWLPKGDYTYYIKCLDLGGNSEVATTSFTVESDSASPLVVRAFHDGSYLKIITNEDAECVYDTIDCSYDFVDGLKMNSNDNEHYTDWNTEINLYIKCADEYGNEPVPNDRCSFIARAFGL